MIVLGVVLIVLGLVLSAVVPAFAYAHLVLAIGIILLVVGLALMLIGRIGHAVGGRRHRSEAATSHTQLKEWDRADQLDPASQTPQTPQISMSKKYAGFAVTAVMAAGLGLAGLGAPAEAQAQPGPFPQWCAGPFFDNGFVGIWDQTGCHDIYRGPRPDRGGYGDRGPDRGGLVTTADQRSGGQGNGGH
jgi:quinol-cytochrome oxidoreductase complex cytochrome b subunit